MGIGVVQQEAENNPSPTDLSVIHVYGISNGTVQCIIDVT